MALKLKKPWWLTDSYDIDEAIPPQLQDDELYGPHGVALVRLWPNGTTSQGWGLTGKNGEDGFMPRYNRKEFAQRRVLYGYNLGKWAFAFVVRSMNVVVIDIDGKNGGIEHADEFLANSPPTLAETSKSGNGYHLFYRTEETWDATTGFGQNLADHIGVVQGVDVRATGCIYHHAAQRWNGRELAPLPDYIRDRLLQKQQQREIQRTKIDKTMTLDETEILMLHDELITELKKPIPAGKRNITLFAIGSKLREADVPDWEEKLELRAFQVGLDKTEIDKLISNINAYS